MRREFRVQYEGGSSFGPFSTFDAAQRHADWHNEGRERPIARAVSPTDRRVIVGYGDGSIRSHVAGCKPQGRPVAVLGSFRARGGYDIAGWVHRNFRVVSS